MDAITTNSVSLVIGGIGLVLLIAVCFFLVWLVGWVMREVGDTIREIGAFLMAVGHSPIRLIRWGWRQIVDLRSGALTPFWKVK